MAPALRISSPAERRRRAWVTFPLSCFFDLGPACLIGFIRGELYRCECGEASHSKRRAEAVASEPETRLFEEVAVNPASLGFASPENADAKLEKQIRTGTERTSSEHEELDRSRMREARNDANEL